MSEEDAAAFREAKSLAEALFRIHYAHEPEYAAGWIKWEPLDTTAGIITQIDNMVSGLVRPTSLHHAAPDLLAALEDAIDLFDQDDSIVARWRAVIAKATPTTPG